MRAYWWEVGYKNTGVCRGVSGLTEILVLHEEGRSGTMFLTCMRKDSCLTWPTLPFIVLNEKVLTIDRIQLQDSAHIRWLRADQLQDGDVPQTCVTMATATAFTTHTREKQISFSKSQTSNKNTVSVHADQLFFFFFFNLSVALLVQAEFTVAVYYWNHPEHWFSSCRVENVVVRRVLPKSCFLWCEKAHIKHRRTQALLGESQVLNTRIKPLRPSAQSAGRAFVWGREGGNCPVVSTQPRATHEGGKKAPTDPGLGLLISKTSHLTHSHGKTVYRHILTSYLGTAF